MGFRESKYRHRHSTVVTVHIKDNTYTESEQQHIACTWFLRAEGFYCQYYLGHRTTTPSHGGCSIRLNLETYFCMKHQALVYSSVSFFTVKPSTPGGLGCNVHLVTRKISQSCVTRWWGKYFEEAIPFCECVIHGNRERFFRV